MTGPARSSARPEPACSHAGPEHVPPVPALSYTSLQQHARCGYRFYLERVLRLPPTDLLPYDSAARRTQPAVDPRVRGRVVHSLLEQLDFARPQPPDSTAVAAAAARAGVTLPTPDAEEIAALVAGFATSALRARLARAKDVRREQPFSLPLATTDGTTIPLVGVFDVIARERQRTLVVDYKSDRLDPAADPAELAADDYALQRAAYALAVLHDGALEVEVVHCFLERPDEPAVATYGPNDLRALEAELAARADAVLARDFAVAPDPGSRICDGCPGRGSLCSWPLERTRGALEGRLL